MKAAYVDTSCLVAIAFGERGAARVRRSLLLYDELLSSNLLEAELRSALRREKVTADAGDLISGISWVYPDRPLTAEIASILDTGYLRGADLWHLAVALFVDPSCEIDFLSLDVQQLEISRRVGFGPR
ncbi:MAG: PIN domain-containing protein [Acidobacteriota bacterium]